MSQTILHIKVVMVTFQKSVSARQISSPYGLRTSISCHLTKCKQGSECKMPDSATETKGAAASVKRKASALVERNNAAGAKPEYIKCHRVNPNTRY